MVRRIISNHAPKPGCYVDADSFVRKNLILRGTESSACDPRPSGRCLPGMVSLPLLLQRLSCFSFSACIHHRGHCRYRLTAFSLYSLRTIDFSFGTFHIRQSLWQTNRFTEIKIYDQSVDEIERKYLFFSDKLTLIDEFYVL